MEITRRDFLKMTPLAAAAATMPQIRIGEEVKQFGINYDQVAMVDVLRNVGSSDPRDILYVVYMSGGWKRAIKDPEIIAELVTRFLT